MGSFQIHQSNRVELLVSELATALERPRGNAFEQEAVVVPGRGMGVWLSMELSKRLGVWATPLSYPRAFVEDVARRVLGQNALGAEPLSEELIEWGLRAVLPGLLREPDFAGLARYLAHDPHAVRLSELCQRLANVFDQYLTYRPEWARVWEGGGVVSVGPEERFQPLLFRRVMERLRCKHVGELEPLLLERLAEPRRLGLPPRVSVLGVSTLPPLFVRVLVALSQHTDVHLYLFAPSRELEPEARADARRPLLAALGQVGVELDQVLRATLEEQNVTAIWHDAFAAPRSDTLLGALQTSLLDPAAPAPVRAALDAGESIAVHACHGPSREVEVLHDQLLALLTREADPVAPEDVLVLVSEMETYAPLIEATFRRDAEDARFVPFHVADGGGRGDSALSAAFLRVLGLVRGRVTGSEVLDLLLLEPVRRRLGIDLAGADTIKTWVAESGVRWGMDAEHREASGLPPAGGANTWRFGLQRLLLGYAMPTGESHAFGGLIGFEEVEGNDAVLLGALAGFVRTLFGWLRDLERPRSLEEWSGALTSLLALLFEETPETLRQTSGIRRALTDLLHAATVAGFEGPLDVAVMRRLIERRVEGLSPERGFLAGGVTFSAMVPMRSIPFRVIALLGMNDGAFPRSPRPVEFDLLKNGQNPRSAGDRSPREDDRYLFLETLCAAREKLLVTYSGKSVRDDRELAPSVCLSELLDALAGQLGTDTSRERRAALIVHHRLQSFSVRYFDGQNPRLWSYAEEHARGAQGLFKQASERSFVGELPALEPIGELELEDLVRFFKSPPKYLLNRRLGIYLKGEETGIKTREPLDFDALGKWKLGDPLVKHCLEGAPLEKSRELLRGRGELPFGIWGERVLEERRQEAQSIADTTLALRGGEERPARELGIVLESGLRLTGQLASLYPGGRVEHTISKAAPKRLLALWLRHLALCASGPPERSSMVTRGDKGPVTQALPPLAEGEAKAHLAELVALFLEGRKRVLPFLPAPSHAFRIAVRGGAGPRAKAKSAEGALTAAVSAYEKEAEMDPHAPLAFDQRLPPFDAGFDAGERPLEETEFHRLAVEVCDPMLEHLEGKP